MENIRSYTAVELKECEDGSGDTYFEIPPEILKSLGWSEGDDVKFDVLENGSVQIRKVKYETVELEFDDEELFKMMQMAHERGQTFNEFCAEALEAQIVKSEDVDECG